MVRRRRKVDPSAMLWTLALGFGTGRERTLAGLRRMYQRATGTSLVPSAFYDRFTPELVRFLRRVVGELCGRLSEHEPARNGLLAKFADVMVADATVVKLHRLLARRYPGTRTNSSPAAAKLHLVMSVTGRGVERVKLTGERANDHRTLRIGPWVRDRLLVFDLGFFRYQLFALTETAATSCRDCPRARIRASWACTVAGVGAPSSSRDGVSMRWPTGSSARPLTSRWRSSSSAVPMPVAGAQTGAGCGWSACATPTAVRTGST
jgi:hypothetical protein